MDKTSFRILYSNVGLIWAVLGIRAFDRGDATGSAIFFTVAVLTYILAFSPLFGRSH